MIKLLKIQDVIDDLDPEYEHIEKFKEVILKLESICVAQDGFQQKAMKQEEWWLVEEINGKPVNYITAILGELGEAVESLDFEWWASKSEEDKANFIVELIDILHFELSKTMKMIMEIVNAMPESFEKNELPNALLMLLATDIVVPLSDDGREHFSHKGNLYKLIDNYIFKSIQQQYTFSADSINYTEVLQDENAIGQILSEVISPLKILFLIFDITGVSFDEVIDRYNLKNALNQVRKLNGYKEGTYIKNWVSIKTGQLVEDNVVAVEEVFGKNLTIPEIVEYLDNYYKENIK